MNDVKFPALVGDSPLAILAAIGTMKLVHDFVDVGATLSWDPADRMPVLGSSLEDVGEVVSCLTKILEDMPEGVTVPGGPIGFPPPGEAPDKLRVKQGELRGVIDSVTESADLGQAEVVREWVSGLVTDLVVDSSSRGASRGAISQFMAPSGRQSMATMLQKTLEIVQDDPVVLREAFTGWRRVSGVTGEYLDHRASWSSSEDGRGKAGMRGVPGATWLALMSYPLWMTTSVAATARTSGWHRLPEGQRHVSEVRLPLWSQRLGLDGVVALVEHPLLDVPWSCVNHRALNQLGVFHVCRARRRQAVGGKSAGVLVPVP